MWFYFDYADYFFYGSSVMASLPQLIKVARASKLQRMIKVNHASKSKRGLTLKADVVRCASDVAFVEEV